MELSNLSPAALTNIIRLVEEKQSLLGRLTELDAAMAALITNNAPASSPRRAKPVRAMKSAPPNTAVAPVPATAVKPAAPKRAKRGALKEGILAALEEAGPDGLAASALAARLGVEPANVHVWFATTGKKIPSIAKVGPGRYALVAATTAAASEPALPPEPSPAAPLSEIAAEAPAEDPAPLPSVAVDEPAADPAPAPAPAEISSEDPGPAIEPDLVEESTIEPVAEDAPAPKDEEFQLLASD